MISPFQAGLMSIALGTGSARIPRETVQRHLWGDHDDKVVRHRLSQLIYQTNQRCEGKFVELQGEFVRVHRGFVESDLDDLAKMVRSESLAEACDLLEHGFLSAFPKRRSDAFSMWMEEQHVAIRAGVRQAAVESWDASAATHDWARARVAAEALLRLDPDEEVVLRRVMRARAMGGMVREAEAAYRSFAERTAPYGEWNPEPATQKLLKAVRAAKPPIRERPRVSNHLGLRVPFRGRADELLHLSRSLYEKSIGGPPSVITVSGEAGLGKTRLVDEAIEGTAFRGYRVIHANATEIEREISLSPLLEGLNQPWVVPILSTLPEPWRSVLLSLLPQLHEGPEPPPQVHPTPSGSLPRVVCDAFLRLFGAIAQSEQTILILDDFQWADHASAAVLQFLLRRSSAANLTLLFVYRPEELRGSRVVRHFIQELESEPEVTTIRLEDIDGSAARRLVRSVSSEALTDRQVDEIEALAGGNPLFLTELAASPAAKHGSRLSLGLGAIQVPSSVRQVFGRRLSQLDATSKKLLSGLAVLGQSATTEQLIQITGCTLHECVDAIDKLQALRLVTWTEAGMLMRYDILRHTVYGDLSQTRRSMLHARAAELLRSGSADPPLDEVAHHYFLGGDRELAHAYALEAVKGAKSKAPLERLRLLEVAYEVSYGWGRDSIAATLVQAYHRTRRLAATVRMGKEVLKRVEGLSPSESIGIRLMVTDARDLLRLDDANSILADLASLEREARREGDEDLVASILDTTLRVLRRSGDRRKMSALAKRIMKTKSPRKPVVWCRILGAVTMATLDGDPKAGLGFARRAMKIARRIRPGEEPMLALRAHIAALKANGLLATEEGRESLAEVVPWSKGNSDLASRVLLMLDLAGWHTSAGDYGIAARVLEDADKLTGSMDCPLVNCLTQLTRGNLALGRGDIAAAQVAFYSAGGKDSMLDEGKSGSDWSKDPVEEGETEGVPAPESLTDRLAALGGQLYLETGRIGQARRLAEDHPLDESPVDAPSDLILFHARLRSREGDTAGALAVLEAGALAKCPTRPMSWVRLVLELVRLARRTGSPQPELAQQARDKASELHLPGLAHEFVPFVD